MIDVKIYVFLAASVVSARSLNGGLGSPKSLGSSFSSTIVLSKKWAMSFGPQAIAAMPSLRNPW